MSINNNEGMKRLLNNASKRKAVILEENIDSLMRFQQMDPKMTNEDISIARIFIGSCLVEKMVTEIIAE